MTSLARSLPAAIASGCLMVAAGGCAPKLRALEHPGQTVLRKGRAALIEREGLAVIVTPVAVGLEEDELLVGAKIELLNQSTRAVRLARQDTLLVGDDGLRRLSIAPDQFKRYAEMAQGDPPPTSRPASPRVYVSVGHGGWYHHADPYWYRYAHPWYRHYAYPHWPYDPPYYDPYYYEEAAQAYYRRRERVARFVASLWRTRTVQPGFVAVGHVVFDYELRRKEAFTVEMVVHRVPTTQPTTAPTSQPLQPAPIGPLPLRFYFKT